MFAQPGWMVVDKEVVAARGGGAAGMFVSATCSSDECDTTIAVMLPSLCRLVGGETLAVVTAVKLSRLFGCLRA